MSGASRPSTRVIAWLPLANSTPLNVVSWLASHSKAFTIANRLDRFRDSLSRQLPMRHASAQSSA